MNESSEEPPGALRIGAWSFEPRSGSLRRGDEVKRLEPLVADLLTTLAGRPGEVFGKEELLRDVWSGRFVGDDVLTAAVYQLRQALGDEARKPRYVENLPKRGYRLIAPVTPASDTAEGRTAPSPRSTGGRGWWAAAVVVLLAVLLVGLVLPRLRGGYIPSAALESFAGGRAALAAAEQPEDLERARALLERASHFAPSSAPVQRALLDAYLRIGDRDAIARQALVVARLAPEAPELRRVETAPVQR